MYHFELNHVPYLLAPIVVIYAIFSLIFKSGARKSGPKDNEIYLRGSRLIDAASFQKTVTAEAKTTAREIKIDTGSAPSLKEMKGVPFVCSADKQRVELWNYILDRHMAFIGATGAGKSTQIKHFLERSRSAGEKCIVLDINGELYAEMGRPGDYILSLYDKRTEPWDLYQEHYNGRHVSSTQLADFLVPSGSEHDKFWWQGARIVLKQMIDSCASMEELQDLILGGGDIFSSLSDTAKSITGDRKSTQSAGIIAHCLLELGFLRDINYWPKSFGKTKPFSFYAWAQNEAPSWVFIPVKDDDLGTMSPLLKIWFNLAIIGCFARTPEGNYPKINVVIDEASSIGKLENLGKSLDRLRKYSARMILAYHSEGHFKKLYGHDEAAAISGQIGTKFIFRIKESGYAKETAALLGSCEIIRRNKGASHTVSGSGGSSSYSETVAEKPVVLSSEIQQLRDGWFYLSSLSFMPCHLRIKHHRWPQVNSLHRDEHEVPSSQKFTKKNEPSKSKFSRIVSNILTEIDDVNDND